MSRSHLPRTLVLTLALLGTPGMIGSTGNMIDECTNAETIECSSRLMFAESDEYSVCAFSFLNCAWQTDQLLPGFIITRRDTIGVSSVLWGQFEECYTLEMRSVDLDGTSPCEVLTLFMDEHYLWGDIHRLTYSEDGIPELQSLSIPFIGFSDYADRTGVLFSLTSGIGLRFEGTCVDSATCTVVLDDEADSLALVIAKVQPE